MTVLRETRFRASGRLTDLEYTFNLSGKPIGERREAGVSFTIKRDIASNLTEMPHPVNDKIMTMIIPLTKNATIVSAYIPASNLDICNFGKQRRMTRSQFGVSTLDSEYLGGSVG